MGRALASLATWRNCQFEFSAAQTGSAMLVHNCCRSLMSMTPATASVMETFVAAPVADVSTAAIAKWSNTVSETSERSAPVLTRDANELAYGQYSATKGAPPSLAEECAQEQLTVIKAMLAADEVPLSSIR
eukprot:4709727-Amphidinium_carterae.1